MIFDLSSCAPITEAKTKFNTKRRPAKFRRPKPGTAISLLNADDAPNMRALHLVHTQRRRWRLDYWTRGALCS